MPLFLPAPPAPQIIGNDVATQTGNTQTAVANNVYLWAFEIQSSVTIVGTRWRNATTAAGSTNMGVYTAAGNLVSGSDTGAVADAVSSTVSFTYTTPFTIGPGQYFLALACNAADTFQGVAPLGASASRAKRATNNLAAGALPLTTGTIVTNPPIAPGMAALVSGGIV